MKTGRLNKKTVYADKIYRAKKDFIYGMDNPQYDCYRPVNTGNWSVFDAWVCDKFGNVHPGYNSSPVPILAERLGKVVV